MTDSIVTIKATAALDKAIKKELEEQHDDRPIDELLTAKEEVDERK